MSAALASAVFGFAVQFGTYGFTDPTVLWCGVRFCMIRHRLASMCAVLRFRKCFDPAHGFV